MTIRTYSEFKAEIYQFKVCLKQIFIYIYISSFLDGRSAGAKNYGIYVVKTTENLYFKPEYMHEERFF